MDIKIDRDTTVVFDLDDTLFKEIDFLKSAYREIAETLVGEDWQMLYGYMFALYREGKNVFQIISDNYKLDLQALVAQYRSHEPHLNLADGALELLRAIQAKGGNLAILTDGRTRTQTNKVKSLRIQKLVDKVFISEELGSEKPNESNFITVEAHFQSSHFLYIADNLKKDFITPNRRGWKTIGLIDNGLNIHFSSHYYLQEKYIPQHVIFSHRDINIL